jgi:hypothetical protein
LAAAWLALAELSLVGHELVERLVAVEQQSARAGEPLSPVGEVAQAAARRERLVAAAYQWSAAHQGAAGQVGAQGKAVP